MIVIGRAVEECLTRDRGGAGSSLTGVTVLCPWAKRINPSLVLVLPRKTLRYITERLLMGHKESNKQMWLLLFWVSSSRCRGLVCDCGISWSNLRFAKIVSFEYPSLLSSHPLLWCHSDPAQYIVYSCDAIIIKFNTQITNVIYYDTSTIYRLLLWCHYDPPKYIDYSLCHYDPP